VEDFADLDVEDHAHLVVQLAPELLEDHEEFLGADVPDLVGT
jgi:hypothetical protein